MNISLLVILIIPYFLLITFFVCGWFKIPAVVPDLLDETPEVSIIVPVKDEEKNLNNQVQDILKQNYPQEKIEVVFVNDHSIDSTSTVLTEISAQYKNIKHISLPEGITGKKMGIFNGIEASSGKLIITTDGDCRFPQNWINSMVVYYLRFPMHLLIGPVLLKPKKGFLNNFLELEFLSLIASGAGASGINMPILCNGANLGADRELFFKGNEIYKSSIASGDDIFLMLELKKKKIPAIFIKNTDAAVETENTSNLKEFVQQRSRWTFKSRFYRDMHLITVALIVLLTNIFLLTGLFYSLFHAQFFIDFLIVYALKCIVDFILLFNVAKYFNRKYLLRYFLIHQLLYIFYISIIGIIGHFSQNKWKNGIFVK